MMGSPMIERASRTSGALSDKRYDISYALYVVGDSTRWAALANKETWV